MINVNFGLEATVLRVTREDYAMLAAPSQDRPGRNKDGEIADQMRSFLVPDNFKEPGSKKVDRDRFINIMFALECSNGDVWLFIDHSRLMRFEVHSRGEDWTEDDVQLESEVGVSLSTCDTLVLTSAGDVEPCLRREVRAFCVPGDSAPSRGHAPVETGDGTRTSGTASQGRFVDGHCRRNVRGHVHVQRVRSSHFHGCIALHGVFALHAGGLHCD